MDHQQDLQGMKDALTSFRELFKAYHDEIYGDGRQHILDDQRSELQLKEPQVTDIILRVLGAGTVTIGGLGRSYTIADRDLLPTALLGGNNEMKHNFHDYYAPANSLINRTVGRLQSGLWPPVELRPVLTVNDNELRNRCTDLLSAPGSFDRVVREATTVLEDRIRTKAPHALLSRLIPNSADQIGQNLVDALLAPNKPVIVFSSDKNARISIHKMLSGVFSYVRNPFHHKLHPSTEWSWAWSVVGVVDRLLADIDSSTVAEE